MKWILITNFTVNHSIVQDTDMKKILKVVASPLLFLNKLYKKTNHYNNQFVDVRKFTGNQAFTLDIPHDLDIVNLGSNQPKFAFDYTGAGVKGMNWAVGPQTLEYDFMILKKFHSFLKEGAFVVIPICPLKMFLYKFSNVSSVVKYYGCFDKDIIPDYDETQYKHDFRFPLIWHHKRIRFLLKDVQPDKRMELTYNPMSEDQIQYDADYWIDGCWNKEFSIDICNMSSLSDLNKKSIQTNISILRDMIMFCIERSYRPVIVYLPVTEPLVSKFSDEFVDRFIKAYVSEAISGLGIPVYDYMKDRRFQKNEYYINSFFMNRVGARFFTEEFMKDLKL